jgi:cellulose synthase/poly-beta-1,6-N-acetylglucosamine synthase-like glycosyltransferase
MDPGFLAATERDGSPGRWRRCAFRRETWWSRMAIGLTLAALAGFALETAFRLHDAGAGGRWDLAAQTLLGRGLIAFFLLSALAYQATRLGYLARYATHRPIPEHALARAFDTGAPSLLILVPSYMEEPPVIRRTLLAAALQQSPSRRVVLLIDNPPAPRDAQARERLAAARDLPREIEALLAAPCRRFEGALSGFLERWLTGTLHPRSEAGRLAALWSEAAGWIDALAADTERRDHYDALFVERILRAPGRDHRRRARAWRAAATGGPAPECDGPPATEDLHREYRRLAALFRVELASFERKLYANLSHEPNKAMNLNAYLALLGRGFRERLSPQGRMLAPAGPEDATLLVPDADFVIVLDADSVILPEYSLRLVHFMIRPGNEAVAVAQTPYAAVPGAPSAIERIAGATTDVQLMAHQGATRFGAGSWVGASALIRRAALDDVVLTQEERGHPVAVYVRDRTLTEDTDTTVALIRKGWRVHNYPGRLAYSATPPDFGSLLIQRRRWATGGLIILADLWRYLLQRPGAARLGETLIRAQYLLGAPLGSIGVVVLLVCPSTPGAVWTPWALPAFAAWLVIYGRDLRHNGGRLADLFRALALNAMLLPVNLAGALNSIGQLWTGRKIPFQRTPKVRDRTAAPPLHVAAQFGLLLLTGMQLQASIAAGDWLDGAFFASYAAGFAYSLHEFIGWGAARDDLILGLGEGPRALLERLREGLSAARRRVLREE